jgi:hypothetical protein
MPIIKLDYIGILRNLKFLKERRHKLNFTQSLLKVSLTVMHRQSPDLFLYVHVVPFVQN